MVKGATPLSSSVQRRAHRPTGPAAQLGAGWKCGISSPAQTCWVWGAFLQGAQVSRVQIKVGFWESHILFTLGPSSGTGSMWWCRPGTQPPIRQLCAVRPIPEQEAQALCPSNRDSTHTARLLGHRVNPARAHVYTKHSKQSDGHILSALYLSIIMMCF